MHASAYKKKYCVTYSDLFGDMVEKLQFQLNKILISKIKKEKRYSTSFYIINQDAFFHKKDEKFTDVKKVIRLYFFPNSINL